MIAFAYSCELTGLLSFAFVVALLLIGPRRPVNLLWCLMCAAIGSYCLGQGKSVSSATARESFFWYTRFQYLGANMIPVFFLHFTTLVLEINRHRLIAAGYLCAALLQWLSFSGRLFYVHSYSPFRFYGFPLPSYPIYLLYFFGLVIYSLWLLYRHMGIAEERRKNKLRYLFWSMAIGFMGGATTFFPLFHIAIFPYGVFAIPIYIIGTSYAIIRHQLMDIRVVIRKTLVYSMVTATFASIYAGVVTLIARLLENRSITAAPFAMEIFTGIFNDPKFYSIGFMVGFISVSCMAVFVAWIKPRRHEAVLWSVLSFLVADWFLGRYMIMDASSAEQAFFWQRVMYIGAIYLNVVFYHFVCAFLKNWQKNWFLYVGYIVATILAVTNMMSHLFVSTMVRASVFTFYEHVGPLYPIHIATYLLYPGIGVFRLLRERNKTDDRVWKNKIDYVLSASLIGFICGLTTFPMTFNSKFPPIGAPFIPIYSFIIVYAIVAHQLLDIAIVIRKTLLYSLVSAVLASIYVGTITLLAHALQGWHSSSSAFSSSIAAIFITLLFNPLRLRTQRWIDRHFPRERLDPALLQEAAGGFAHEMKRPLSKISLPAELALMDLERVKSGDMLWEDALPSLEQRLRFIKNQSVDAGYMIEAIRELSTSSAMPFVPVDLRQMIEHALIVEKELLEKFGITVRLSLPSDLPMVTGRAKQLEIVFINLIKNAAEAMSPATETLADPPSRSGGGLPRDKKRELSIMGEFSESEVVIRLTDTGSGIRPEDLTNVFQPQYTTKGPYGTGMGLYLSRQIVQAHRGTMDVHSEPAQGTEFIVRLLR